MSEQTKTRYPAILLVGPTGAGKTPLGEMLEKEGLWGRRCLHFDFGSQLRAAASHSDGPLAQRERDLVQGLLDTGGLLEDEHFRIARKLLAAFLAGHNADTDTFIVLNGLPRHPGQARDIADMVEVQGVIELACSPETVWQRIKTNAGGDRAGRPDDTLEEVTKRLETFQRRTAPLLDYYRSRGVPVLRLEVGASTTAAEMRQWLEAHPFP